MFERGIKASELIAELQKLVEKHGDLEVYRAGVTARTKTKEPT